MDGNPPNVQWPKSIFKHWGKPILQEYGALELPDAQPSSLSNAIHPLFAAHKWTVYVGHDYMSHPPFGEFDTSINRDDYHLLRPSLRLASQFLAEPALLPFWHALLFGPRFPIPTEDIQNAGRSYTGGYASFTRHYNPYKNSYAISTAEVRRTHNALRSLADMTTLELGPMQEADVWATTRRIFTQPASPHFPGTASIITINIHLLHALRSHHLTPSAQLRVQYFLGIALVHELAHAAHNAHTAMRGAPNLHGTYDHSQLVHEPFFETDILAEAGHAWEQSVLTGTQMPFYMHPECGFGLQFEKWPGLQSVPGNVPTRRKRKRWTTVYALPMRFVQAALTDGFWEGVGRYGAGEVRAPKEVGWRLWLSRREVGGEREEGGAWDGLSLGRSADTEEVSWPVGDVRNVNGIEDIVGVLDPMEID